MASLSCMGMPWAELSFFMEGTQMQVVKDSEWVRESARCISDSRIHHSAIIPRISVSCLESLPGISGLQSSDRISESKMKKKQQPYLQTSISVSLSRNFSLPEITYNLREK